MTALGRRRHIDSLDGLRGLAALVVVVRHTFNAVDVPIATRHALFESPLAPLFSGQGAVQLFFVLSGWVLASSLDRNRRALDTLQFYVKRFFRIHPPFIAAVLLAWLAIQLRPTLPMGHSGLTPWLHFFASVSPPLSELVPHLAFPGPALNVLPIGWTLTIEMLYSLLLPPLFLLARRAHPLAPLALLGTATAVLPGISQLWHSVAFCLGLAAYLERERLSRWFGATRLLGVALTACGLVLFSWPLLGDWSIVRFGLLVQPVTLRSTLTLALGSVLLVVAAVHVGWLTRLLSTRPMRFLGRISYSLYLIHFLVLIACAPLANGSGVWSDFAKLLGAVLVVSLALAALGYRIVERTSIRLGNRICDWLAPRIGSTELRSERADAGE